MTGSTLMLAMLLGASPGVPPPPIEAPASRPLRWEAPAGCPTEATVERTLRAALGDRVTPELGIEARATVRQGAGQWQLELQLGPDEGAPVRRIEADSCRALASAAVLVLAIVIDPEFSSEGQLELVEEEPVKPAEEPEAEPVIEAIEAEPVLEAEPEPARAPEPAGGLELELRTAAGPGLRLLPRVTAALELALGLVGQRFRVELGASYWTPTRQPLGPSLEARFQLTAATVRACGVPGVAKVRFPLCGGVDVGVMSGRGREGFAVPKTARQVWTAARAGGFVVWRLHPRVSGWLGAEAVVALSRPSFGTDDATDLRTTPGLGGVVSLGVAVRLTAPKAWGQGVR